MPRLALDKLGLNFWVIAGMMFFALMLGILNNLRVFEEQRVPWFGGVAEEETGDHAEVNP